MGFECCGEGAGARVAALAAAAPGPELVATLAEIDVAEVRCEAELLEVVAAWDRVVSWANARQLSAVAEFSRRPNVFRPEHEASFAARGPVGRASRQFGDDEIAARLGISRVAASARVEAGAALAGALSATGEALAAGAIDLSKARVIVEGCRDLPVDVAAEAQARVLPRAGGQNPGRLKKSLRAAILAADPSLAQRRETTAKTERRVVISPVADGMAELWALLPAVDATAIDTALNAAARAMKTGRPGSGAGLGDVRTMDQRRADALAAPFHAALASGTLDGVAPRLAKRRGARAQLLVTVPASTLLGVTAAPGELAGYGPISADVARHIATDATWRRVLTDPVGGAVLDVGVTTYRPPAGLDRLVKTRDNTCCFPGCNWPAVDCELDHTKPFPQGPTAAHNLGPCCKRHHLFKHTAPAGARLRQISPGVFRWTMPTGHTHTVNAPAVALPLKEELRIKSPEAEGPPTARDP